MVGSIHGDEVGVVSEIGQPNGLESLSAPGECTHVFSARRGSNTQLRLSSGDGVGL